MGRQVTVAVRGRAGRAGAATVPDDPPTVTLTMDQETFWRLGFGRVDRRGPGRGQVAVEGDIALGHRVLGRWPS